MQHMIRVSVLALGTVAAVFGAAAPAGAQAADTLRACFVKGSGSVYRVGVANTPATCTKPTHYLFSWSSADGNTNGSGGSTTAHGQLTGLGNDDHAQYLLTEGLRQSINGFAVTGSFGQGTLPVSGPGSRLMWYPRKSAFRVGGAGGDHWDDANIGIYSVAFGSSTRASGPAAVAFGSLTTASGELATAMGFETTASGPRATAMGYKTLANGYITTAMGSMTHASGQYATAMGYSTSASGLTATAMGNGSEASGGNSTAMGNSVVASGANSTAMGNGTVASGANSTAMGMETLASGISSTAMGRHASTNGRMGAFVYGDASTSSLVAAQMDNHFVARAQRFWFGNNNSVTATTGRFIETHTGAYLSSGGAWINSSDVNRKHEFRAVDVQDVLERVASLPISTWSYRDDEATVRHIGPMAQDFHAAFGLGDSDTAIATVDADGVSLAAIQALDGRTREHAATIDALRHENAVLRAMLADVQQRISSLETRQ